MYPKQSAPSKNIRKRKLINLQYKLDIIKRFDNGERKARIASELGMHESTVRDILKKSNQYLEKGDVVSTSYEMQCTRNRSEIMIEMEDLLLLWLEDCSRKCIKINSNDIMMKALNLFSTLNENKYPGVSTIFSASNGCLSKFKS